VTTEAASLAETRWAAAQDALGDMVGRVTALLRTLPDANAASVGEWTAGEVAMHLSQVWLVVPGLARGDLADIHEVLPDLEGTAGESLITDVWELGEVTKLGVASDDERNLHVLADRIDERAAAFFAAAADHDADEPRPWLVKGTKVPRSALTGHLLYETIVHGYDIAKSAGVAWRIERPYAALVLRGFLVEAINALDTRAMVDQRRAAGLHARYDVRLWGGERVTFAFADGELHIGGPTSQPVDCHILADPAALLLITSGRKSQWGAIAKGQLMAWGRRPWLGPRFRSLMRNP
jgi:hypothetical protein